MQYPQIHDRVLYHPAPDDKFAMIGNQPLAAIVCGVHNKTCVNLVIFDAKGLAWNRESVLFCRDEAGGRWCEPLLARASGPFVAYGAAQC